MSYSAPHSKMPSPARTPPIAQDGQRPERERTHKPPGIINMGMTCFLNSTFQALSATPALIALLSNNPALPLYPSPSSMLPNPPQPPRLTPCLSPDALEPPLYGLLPVTRAFTNSLHKAWTTKDRGGGTAGAGEASSVYSISLSQLLRELARKYDQYDEFAQQDAHELLRHLLDSMEMEEKDVIKRVQPANAIFSPAQRPVSVLVTPGAVASPLPSFTDSPNTSPPTNSMASSLIAPANGSTGDLVPFVDTLFGGLLSSIVVCDTCKSVSHTYEGFLDISLCMPGDDSAPRVRKRDKLRAMFKPRAVSQRIGGEPAAVMSEAEGSDSERGAVSKPRLAGLGVSLQSGDETELAPPGVKRTPSVSRSLSGLRARPSFSFRRKGAKAAKDKDPSAVASRAEPPQRPLSPSASAPPSPPSRPTSPLLGHHEHIHQRGPTPAQAAYIQRILYGPPGAPEASDPLAKLRAAHAGGLGAATPATDSGLLDCLKAFTSVEILEGDNAFACHKCWKIKNGHYSRKRRLRGARDAGASAPAIAITSSDAVSPSASPAASMASLPERGDGNRLGRLRTTHGVPGPRAPSPLRQHVERSNSISIGELQRANGETGLSDVSLRSMADGSSTSLGTTSSTGSLTLSAGPTPLSALDDAAAASDVDDSDGLSDSTDNDDDEPAPGVRRSHLFRPALTRAQTRNKHYILRKAYKRYLVARAPEVLVFHLKRFRQVAGGVYSSFSSLKKIDDFISFPETIDLAPFLSPNRNDYRLTRSASGKLHAPFMDWKDQELGRPGLDPLEYSLYAIVVHMGTMVGGHYIAYVLVDPERLFQPPGPAQAQGMSEPQGWASPEDAIAGATERLGGLRVGGDRRVWCYCSDTEIRLASLDEVMSARAYLCFYERSAVSGAA